MLMSYKEAVVLNKALEELNINYKTAFSKTAPTLIEAINKTFEEERYLQKRKELLDITVYEVLKEMTKYPYKALTIQEIAEQVSEKLPKKSTISNNLITSSIRRLRREKDDVAFSQTKRVNFYGKTVRRVGYAIIKK